MVFFGYQVKKDMVKRGSEFKKKLDESLEKNDMFQAEGGEEEKIQEDQSKEIDDQNE